MAVYEGFEHHNVTVDGKELELCLDIARHSPTGFSWGYLGSGPAQLACAIMVNEYGRDLEIHPVHYQKLKEELISKLDDDSFTITSDEITEIVKSNIQ